MEYVTLNVSLNLHSKTRISNIDQGMAYNGAECKSSVTQNGLYMGMSICFSRPNFSRDRETSNPRGKPQDPKPEDFCPGSWMFTIEALLFNKNVDSTKLIALPLATTLQGNTQR